MMGVSNLRFARWVAAATITAGLVFAGTAAAQTPPLGEVARKEAERRKALPPAAKVYTSKDLPESARTPPPAPAADADPSAAPDPATPAQKKEQPAEPARGEAWWRDRMVKAREDLRRDEVLAESLQSRINVLSRDFVGRDNPVQRAQIGQERAEALEELAAVRASIARGRQQIEDIEEEARRAAVPPGWLR